MSKARLLTLWLAYTVTLCRPMPATAQSIVPHLVSVRFADRNHGWTAGADGLYYTRDGGRTWQRQQAVVSKLQPTEGRFPSGFGLALRSGVITWADQSSAVVLSDGGYLTGTASGAWVEHPPPRGVRLGDVLYFVNPLDGWAMDCHFAHRTTDGGSHWYITNHDPWARCMGPGFLPLSSEEVWIGGDHGRIAHTRDGGKTWAWQRVQGMDGGAVAFAFLKPFGWMLGSTGTRNCFFISRDGGRHWQRQRIPPDPPLTAISFADRKEGWLVGWQLREDSEGTVLHTGDGGKNWTGQASGLSEFLLGVQAMGNGEAWAVGHKGTLLHTTNQGKTWDKVKVR